MSLPTALTPATNPAASYGRDIRAGSSPTVVNSTKGGLGNAMLVYDVASASGSGRGVGQIGKQVFSQTFAGGNATRRFVLGNMLVQSGSSIYGSVGSSALQGGVLLIYDGPNATGKILARIPIPKDNRAFSFGPDTYPNLRAIGGYADTDNDVQPIGSGGTSLGATGIGMQYGTATDNFNPPSTQFGWAIGGGGSPNQTINPASYPFDLRSALVIANDGIMGFAFMQSGQGSVMPSNAADAQQLIRIVKPNGDLVPLAEILDATTSGWGGTINGRVWYPGSQLDPGWYTLQDQGRGNFNAVEDWDSSPSQLNPAWGQRGGLGPNVYVIGGGSGWGGYWTGLYSANPGGGKGITITTPGTTVYAGRFNATARMRYQASATVYSPGVRQISFVALFNPAPTTGRIDVSAVG